MSLRKENIFVYFNHVFRTGGLFWLIYKNNNQILYDYSEINQKSPPVRKTWLK
jgi:hypothetical protein